MHLCSSTLKYATSHNIPTATYKDICGHFIYIVNSSQSARNRLLTWNIEFSDDLRSSSPPHPVKVTPADLVHTPTVLRDNQSIYAIQPMRAQVQGYSTCTRSAEEPKTHDCTRTSAILELRQTINGFIYSTKNPDRVRSLYLLHYEPHNYNSVSFIPTIFLKTLLVRRTEFVKINLEEAKM
jgi:hypothetical protein